MSDIRPFRGIRPRPDLAAAIAAPPYDVVDFDEAKAYVADKPNSFLRIEKSEIQLEKGLETLDPRIFQKGRDTLQAWLKEGKLIQDEQPCFYLYRQKMGKHVQTGVVAGASVDEYQRDLIKKHEHTRKDKEDERTQHVDTLSANTGPVFLTYRAMPALDAFVKKVCKRKKTVDLVSEDGIGHTLWVISKPAEVEELRQLFAAIPHLYVADGHHRSAAASRVQQVRKARNPKHTGQEAYNFFLTVIFPHDQMKIMEYNRVVNDLRGLSPEAFLKKVEEKFSVVDADQASPDRPRCFGMYLGGRWRRLTARPGTFPEKDPVDSLDVAILQNNLLGPVLGIADPRTDKRIQFVGGIRGTAELERRVQKTGGAGVAFAMHPTSIEQLMAIADASKVMPPKSTWFEPKLRSGMVVRSLED
ncbi:MAG TPA: DUF1015 family protein [Myxococcota bacterium]|nr:DUF1015 family protein [Myxococcota bacterium]HRY91926.1 DUF1015 family protein [Myxococcota bacterium]HSA21110.1 DUF1015 family protein [Myxococcota bacterium]